MSETEIKWTVNQELHPSIDYSEDFGLLLGIFVQGNRESKVILTRNHEFNVDFSVVEIKGEESKVRILKKVQYVPQDESWVLDFVNAFRTRKNKLYSVEELRKKVSSDILGALRLFYYHEDPRVYPLIACWAIGTYLYVIFDHFPILVLQGERESGKTTLLELLKHIVRCPIGRSLALREAPLFRTAESLRPTFLFDVQKISERPDLLDLCEACTEPGGYVSRCTGEKQEPKFYHCYTPVALAVREEVPFLPKAIQIITTKPPPHLQRTYTERRLYITKSPGLSELRQNLILCTLEYCEEVKAAYSSVEQTNKLYGRSFDYWRPLLAICKVFLPEKFAELLSFAEEYALKNSPSDFMVEVENEVLRHVLTLTDETPCGDYLKNITDAVSLKFPGFRVSWQKVKSALINLGIVRRFYNKPEGVFVYLDKAKIEDKAKQRFQ